MSEEKPADEELVFGEKLLGMQGFSATRARRYREELEKLLVHRITGRERWSTAAVALVIAPLLVIVGIALASFQSHPDLAAFDQTRVMVGSTCAITGLIFGAWLLRIAIQGGYARRLGDFMSVFIALLFCGGWALAFIHLAGAGADPILRLNELLLAGGMLCGVTGIVLIIAYAQRLHRQTQEKLLRIEYHLAELMERSDQESAG